MKKYLLLLIFSLFLPVIALGGSNPPKSPDARMVKEFKEYKIKFLAQEMELKDDQKNKFADLYSKMMDEKRKNFEILCSLEKQLKDNSSESEYKEVSDKILDTRMRDAQIEKDYDAKFAKFLTQKQIYKMKSAEEKFRRKMQEMHHKKHKKIRPAKAKK